MIEKIITSVLQWMEGRAMGELKNALYYVLSEYDISEKLILRLKQLAIYIQPLYL